MRSEWWRFVVLAALGGAGLSAQNVTVPATLDGIEGGGGTSIPFGSNLACVYQVLYDDVELPWSGPRVLTGISIRPDFNNGLATPQKGFIDVSLRMSTTSVSSATMSSTFEDNVGEDAIWVIQHQVMMLPAQPAIAPPATGPRPANIDLMFQVPWAYGLTPARPNEAPPSNLLVELFIHSQPSGIYRVDNMSSCTAPNGTFGNNGPLCTVPGSPPLAVTGDVSMVAGGIYNWHVANADPNVPFLMFLNLTTQDGLLGVSAWPLPYPMFDPTNPTQQSAALTPLVWPAPDCWVNVNPAGMLGGVADATGTGSVGATLPVGRQYVGTTFYAQALALAPSANPLRMITSLGYQSTVCGPLGVSRVFAYYNASTTPPPSPPATGALQYGVGLVIEVH